MVTLLSQTGHTHLKKAVSNLEPAVNKCRATGGDGLDVDWLAAVVGGNVTGGEPEAQPLGALGESDAVLHTDLTRVGD